MSQYLLLIALLILVPGLIFVPLHWPYSLSKTFSQHVARRRSSMYYYFALFAIVLPILNVFFIKYLIPELNLPVATTFLIVIASITQIGCTIVPELGGLKSKIHIAFAGISALSLLGVISTILLADISVIDRVGVFIANLLMLAIAILVLTYKRKELPALLVQSSYFGLFFIAVLFVAY